MGGGRFYPAEIGLIRLLFDSIESLLLFHFCFDAGNLVRGGGLQAIGDVLILIAL